MEKFTGLLNSPFHFTDNFKELPDFVLGQINKAVFVDWTKENFVASCWIPTTKGKVFILVTDYRVVYSDTIRVNQNLLQDITGVERNLMKNVLLLSPGNETKLFPFSTTPTLKIQDRMYQVINTAWTKSRQSPPQASSSPAPDNVIEKIKELNELKNQGILTEAEFDQKKAELLARI